MLYVSLEDLTLHHFRKSRLRFLMLIAVRFMIFKNYIKLGAEALGVVHLWCRHLMGNEVEIKKNWFTWIFIFWWRRRVDFAIYRWRNIWMNPWIVLIAYYSNFILCWTLLTRIWRNSKYQVTHDRVYERRLMYSTLGLVRMLHSLEIFCLACVITKYFW